jgi:Ala-tRNA(Pro) deacylase
MHVAAFLSDNHVTFETIAHPPAFTAQKRAHVLHVTGRQVAKSVLLHGPQGYFLAILPATHHIDWEVLAAALGGDIRLATQSEMADAFRDCEWGVVPPFGTLYGFASVMDDSLPPEATLVFEGHSHMEAIRLRCRDFENLEHPRRLSFARRKDTPAA